MGHGGWSKLQETLGDKKIIDRLRSFDPQTVNLSTLVMLEANYTSQPFFNPEAITKKRSKGAVLLCQWVLYVQDMAKTLFQPLASTEAGQALVRAATSACTMDKRAIQELKCFGKPPPECCDVVQAVGLLLDGSAPKNWAGCQKLMANPGVFTSRMQCFDAEKVDEKIWAKLETDYTSKAFFTVDVLKKKSLAAACMC